MTEDRPLLRAIEVRRSFGKEVALAGASLEIASGEIVAVTGRSGAGKSTLLHCLGGLLRPTRGEIFFRDQPLHGLSERSLSALRRQQFGYVLQFGELLADLSLVENVELPLRLLGESKRMARTRAMQALARLEVDRFAHRTAGEVSGGQAQRIAVARALIHRPSIVFADEPTGALDRDSAQLVLAGFLALAREQGTAVLLVTHDPEVAGLAHRQVELSMTGAPRVPARS